LRLHAYPRLPFKDSWGKLKEKEKVNCPINSASVCFFDKMTDCKKPKSGETSPPFSLQRKGAEKERFPTTGYPLLSRPVCKGSHFWEGDRHGEENTRLGLRKRTPRTGKPSLGGRKHRKKKGGFAEQSQCLSLEPTRGRKARPVEKMIFTSSREGGEERLNPRGEKGGPAATRPLLFSVEGGRR